MAKPPDPDEACLESVNEDSAQNDLATARIDTVLSRLLKLAGRIRVTVRRVWLSFATTFPFRQVFMQALVNL